MSAAADLELDRLIDVERHAGTGAPVAYALGKATFMGIDLLSEPGVIVPRVVSELVVRTAARLLGPVASARGAEPLRVIDMCSGSGNIAIAIAIALPTARVWSCDVTPECGSLARRNVTRQELGERVEVVVGDLFAPLAALGLEGTVDAVISSPPFISTGKLAKDRAHLLAHEPREAFDAGPYGLSLHQRIIKEGAAFLRAGGHMVLEVGEGQARQVDLLFKRSRLFDPSEEATDPRGLPLVVAARRRLPSQRPTRATAA